MLKKLFSHTLIYGIAPQIVKVAQVIALPFVTPFLTPKDYGVFGVITSIIGTVSIFSNLGLNIVLFNSFYKSVHQYKWLWRQIYGFLIVWNFIYALLVSIIVYFFIPIEAREHTTFIVILNVAPLVLFGPSSSLGALYYQLSQRPLQIAVRDIFIGIITVTLNIYFIRYLHFGYMGWFLSGAISQILYQFSYFISLNYYIGIKPIFNFKITNIWKQLKICIPTIPHYYSGYILNSFDRIIMKIVGLGTINIGKYNASQTPAGLFSSITMAANQASAPLILETYKKDDRKTELKINFSIAIIMLIGTSIVCLFLKELLPLIIRSKGLENIYSLAIILIMAYNYRPMYVAANQRLFYFEKTKALLKVTFIAALLSILLNFLLIPKFGIYGAAIAMFVSFMYMGYSGFYIKEFKQSNGTCHYPLFWLFLSIFFTAFIFFAVEFNIIYKFLIALLILLSGGGALFIINFREYISNLIYKN